MTGRPCECGCGSLAVKRFICGHQFRLKQNQNKGTHGQSHDHRTPTYVSWNQMRQRCLNPRHHAWKRYGGRGITICQRWLDSFENFLVDMGARPSLGHTIDRKENDGPYAPENCRWATKAEQRLNQPPPSAAQLEGLARARAARWGGAKSIVGDPEAGATT